MVPIAEQTTPTINPENPGFVDRRQNAGARNEGNERRQFINSYSGGRPEVQELAEAIDQYKLLHRRRFITFDELFDVLTELGYHK